MAGLSAYILADTFFISRCAGANGITVLNLAIPLYSLLFALGSMVGIGSATLYAIRSAGKQPGTEGLFSHALLWQLLLGLPFMLLGTLRPELWLQIMGGDALIAALGRDYVRIVLLAAPVFMVSYSFTAFTRNDGAPGTAMTASLIASGFNILFDYIFMFPMGMGLAGAALATSMAPGVSSLICLGAMPLRRSTLRFRRVKPALGELKGSCSLGISAFVGEISSAVTTTVYNFLLLDIAGNLGVAAYGIVTNLSLVAMAFFNGVAQGMQPLVSGSFGRNCPRETRAYQKMGIAAALVLEAAIVFLAWQFTAPLTAIFNSTGDPTLAGYAHTALRLYFLGYLFAGINIVMTAFFSATGKVAQAFAASFTRGALAIIVLAVLMAKLWGLNGIWLSFPAAEAVTLIVVLFAAIK